MTTGEVTPETPHPLLTPHRLGVADFLIEMCDLDEHSDTFVAMEPQGKENTVRNGIAICFPHFGISPDIDLEKDTINPAVYPVITESVITKLKQQGKLPS